MFVLFIFCWLTVGNRIKADTVNVADFLRGAAKTGNQIPQIRSTFLSLLHLLNHPELWLMDELIMSRPLLMANAHHINSIFYQETRTL